MKILFAVLFSFLTFSAYAINPPSLYGTARHIPKLLRTVVSFDPHAAKPWYDRKKPTIAHSHVTATVVGPRHAIMPAKPLYLSDLLDLRLPKNPRNSITSALVHPDFERNEDPSEDLSIITVSGPIKQRKELDFTFPPGTYCARWNDEKDPSTLLIASCPAFPITTLASKLPHFFNTYVGSFLKEQNLYATFLPTGVPSIDDKRTGAIIPGLEHDNLGVPLWKVCEDGSIEILALYTGIIDFETEMEALLSYDRKSLKDVPAHEIALLLTLRLGVWTSLAPHQAWIDANVNEDERSPHYMSGPFMYF